DSGVTVIRKLANAGIRVNIKFTLSRYNINDVPYVFDLAISLGAKSVGIGNMSQPNATEDLSDLMISPAEYRKHLLSMLEYDDSANEAQKQLIQSSLRFNRGLYALLFHELGRYDEFKERIQKHGNSPFPHHGPMPGDPEGQRSGMFVVWEDGSVHVSNANAQPILGTVPQESFQAIHERRIAEGRNQDFPHIPRDPRLANPKNEACAMCPVREHCHGDNRYCWKLK